MTVPRMPSGLAASGKRHWKAIAGDGTYTLRPDELAILEAACREADMVAKIDDQLKDEPLMVPGSMGQMVVNPLVQELRQHRALLVTSMAKLKLPDDPGQSPEAEANPHRTAGKARWAVSGG